MRKITDFFFKKRGRPHNSHCTKQVAIWGPQQLLKKVGILVEPDSLQIFDASFKKSYTWQPLLDGQRPETLEV